MDQIPSRLRIISRSALMHFMGKDTVPSGYFLCDGTVPSRCFLCYGIVPSRYFLHEGTVPSPNHYRISKLTGQVYKAFFPDGSGIYNQNRIM